MKARSYWAIQHVCRAMREMRFTFSCWWLSQRVEFLEWKLDVDGLETQPVPGMICVAEWYLRTRGILQVLCAKLHHNARCIFRCRYSEHLR